MSPHETGSGKETVKPGSERSFGITFAVVFALVALYGLHQGFPAVVIVFLFAAGAAFAVVGLCRPSWLSPLNRAWFRFGLLLSRITQPIVLGMLFFAVVTPIGLMRRVAGADPMRSKGRGAATYWIDRKDSVIVGAGRMTRQF